MKISIPEVFLIIIKIIDSILISKTARNVSIFEKFSKFQLEILVCFHEVIFNQNYFSVSSLYFIFKFENYIKNYEFKLWLKIEMCDIRIILMILDYLL